MTRFLPLAIIFSIPFISHAEPEPLASTEDIFFDDMPIVLSATRLAQPLNEAPMAMTVIDREMIDASGARTIPDLLRLVPGFQVGYFDGNSPVATYHGHGDESSSRIQVMIDGRSVYVPALAAIQWSDLVISIHEIERIEVIRGPNAATYGNNSYLAVVSIITRQAIEDQGHKIYSSLGTHDSIDSYYRYGWSDDNVDFRITAGTNNHDGTDLLNDYLESDYISGRIDSQINNKTNFSYQGGIRQNYIGDHEPPPDHENKSTTAFQQFKFEQITADNHNLSVQYYYNYNDQDLTNENRTIKLGSNLNPNPFDPIDAFPSAPISIKSQRHDIELNFTFNLEKLRLVTGASARLDIVSAENVFINNDTQRNELYRGFTHGEYRASDEWIINAGFMLEKNDVSGTDIAPRISLIHHINKNNTFRIGASKATRTPTLYDQYAYARINQQLTQDGGNPLSIGYQTLLGGTDVLNLVDLISPLDIQSEEITSTEIGLISQLIEKRLTLDLKIFKDETDKLISDTSGSLTQLQPAPQDNFDGLAKYVVNSLSSKMQGLEIALDYKPRKDFRAYGYYAYIDIESTMYNPIGNLNDMRRIEVSAPTNSYGLMLVKHWKNNLDTSLGYYRVGEMDWTDRTGSTAGYFIDRSAQAYNKLDFKISKSQSIGKNKLYFAFIFQNLLEDFYDYNKTEYTDSTLTAIAPDSDSIVSAGSLQDQRFYFELSYTFN